MDCINGCMVRSKPNIFITLWFGTQIKPNSMTETFSFSKTDFVGVAEAKNWPPIWRKDVFKQCPESKILFLGLKGAMLKSYLLEACFDLISSPSPSIKIQIIGGKINENLGFESPLRKVNFFLSFF